MVIVSFANRIKMFRMDGSMFRYTKDIYIYEALNHRAGITLCSNKEDIIGFISFLAAIARKNKAHPR